FDVVLLAHDNQGKVLRLAGLDEREHFKKFIHGSKSAGQDHESVGVLKEQNLSDEEVLHRDESIKIRIGILLGRQFDIATDGGTARFASPAIGRFHDSRAAARHHSESKIG